MKKALVAAILGIAAMSTVTMVNAQGRISLYNYGFGTPVANPIVYGTDSGGPLGQPVTGVSGFTVGMYYLIGDSTAAVNGGFDGSGYDIPSGGLQVASGLGATTPLGDFVPGEYSAAANWIVTGSGAVAESVTVVVVAYNGADYASSTIRGHSQAFLMTTALGTDFAQETGSFMNGFSVFNTTPIPEPSTFALAGLGLASLLIFRRRK